jgi:aminobenzoyl-glutamate utilization protein B
MKAADPFAIAAEWIAAHEPTVRGLSDQIWDFAEPGLCETRSAALLARFLAANGFAIAEGVANLPTAFMATFGEGRPRIGLMCEYDAIPGESQRPSPFPDPDPERRAGFTDLHNGIGAASAAAAAAAAATIGASALPGSLVVFGTPAEKLCIGKPHMAKAGLFDGLDAVIAWHPRSYSTVEWDDGPGCYQAEIFDFHGKSAYGGTPWAGVSALDVATLMDVIVQFTREHIPRDDKVSVNEMISRGGDHPTAIPAHAQAWFVHRGPTRAAIERTSEALRRGAEAAALALGGSYGRRIVAATRPWLPNHALAELCYRNLERAGPPRFSVADFEFARSVAKNLGRANLDPVLDQRLTNPTAGVTREFAGGADDVTEFCWHAPTARIYLAYGLATGSQPNWARSAFTRTGVAHATVVAAARAMAYSVLDLVGDPATLAAAADERRRRVAEAGALPPLLTEGTRPPVGADTAPPYVREHLLRIATSKP